MDLWSEIGVGLVHAVAYIAVALLVLGVGYVLTDLLTPGKLSSVILTEKNPNTTVLAASNLFAAGIVVITAIMVTRDDFGAGLLTTLIFGLVGVGLLALSDLLIDLLTPGKLHDVLCEPVRTLPGTERIQRAGVGGFAREDQITNGSGFDEPMLASNVAVHNHEHGPRVHPGVWFLSVAHVVVGGIVAASII